MHVLYHDHHIILLQFYKICFWFEMIMDYNDTHETNINHFPYSHVSDDGDVSEANNPPRQETPKGDNPSKQGWW